MTLHINSFGQGMPLVLLHGWGFDQSIWHSVGLMLQNRFELFLVDLPGFGQSSMMDWTTFKCALLDSLPAHFALGGWSLGGLFATKLAFEAPFCVTHLFNIASSPCFMKVNRWPGIDPISWNKFLIEFRNNPQDTALPTKKYSK